MGVKERSLPYLSWKLSQNVLQHKMHILTTFCQDYHYRFFNNSWATGVPCALLFIVYFTASHSGLYSKCLAEQRQKWNGRKCCFCSKPAESKDTYRDLITSNQSCASSDGVIMFTGGDYIRLKIKIVWLSLSLVIRRVKCATMAVRVEGFSHSDVVLETWILTVNKAFERFKLPKL